METRKKEKRIGKKEKGRKDNRNGILMTLKLIYQIKATQGITGLIYWIAHIK